MAFGGGLNSSSGGELKLYLRCTGSTVGQTPRSAYRGLDRPPPGLPTGGADPLPRDTWDTVGYGQQAGGTHPTEMHSCMLVIQLEHFVLT